MIVVKVELWSRRTGQKTELARMHITNAGLNEAGTVADYTGRVLRAPTWARTTREAFVRGHRRHDLVVWVLLRRMLQAMGY